jgi:hypothetical protein
MKRVQFYGSTNKNFIYLLPSVVVVNFANQWQIQLCWLALYLDITILKKGWY